MSSNKKIYAPVIAYGGMCRAEYSMSLSALYVKTLQERPDISFFSTGILFESLVSRARNSAAAAALHYKCDYLLFIDADVAFDASDVFKLIDHDKDVVSGVYPKKYISHNKASYLAKHNNKVFENPDWSAFATDFATEINEPFLSQVANGDKLIEVDYAATGFMLIKTNVFKKIVKERPDLKYINEVDGYSSWGENFYNFFPANINPKSYKYESEDYGFCNLWRSLEGQIWVDPSIELQHIGNYAFKGSLKSQADIYHKSIKT